MAIYLVQHGLSLPKDQDPEKGLTGPGKEDTLKIADVAKFYQISVKEIWQSGKKRAAQTAEIFKEKIISSPRIIETSGIKPLDDVKSFAEKLDSSSDVMIVGHLPFMERLVSYLTVGSFDHRVIKFQNSGIVCMDREKDDWYIKWTLNPNIS